MSAEDNKALIRRFYAEIDAGNIDAMDEIVAESYIDHSPPPFPGLAPGRDGVKQAFKIFAEATPGRHVIADQIAEGDKVVTRLVGEGTHTGVLPGAIQPTGNDMRVEAIAVHRVEGGRLVEHWSVKDELSLLQQIGVLPPAEGEAAS